MSKPRSMPPTRKPRSGGRRAADVGGIFDGTVGWEDGQDHFDLERVGVPLIKVTLFRGHNPVTEGQNGEPARAKGRKILARVDPRMGDIPEDGEAVIVAVPAGRAQVHGAAFIIGRAGADPKWIPNRKPGEKLIFGPNNTVIRMKEDGSIYLFTRDKPTDDAEGKTVSLQIKPDGFVFEHPHMSITAGPLGLHAVHSSGARIDLGAIQIPGLPGPLAGLASMLKLSAAMVKVEGSTIEIGPDAPGADNVMKATATIAAIAAMQSQNAAMFGLFSTLIALVAPWPGPGPSPVIAAMAAPLGAVSPLVGAANVLVTGLPASAPTQAGTMY